MFALIDFLKKRNSVIILEKETSKILASDKDVRVVADNEIGKVCELIIVVGGDGSLLHAAKIATQQNLPVIGINRGKLGFLTDIYPEEIDQLEEVLNGKCYEEQRFFLQASISLKDQIIEQDIALNDIVLLSGEKGRMADFSVCIDGQFVCKYRADGLIIATPTGSTAHALAGGGPILHPNLHAVVLVPILSHNLSSRPLVINNNSKITLCIAESNTEELKLTCDGRNRIAVFPRGEVNIEKAEQTLRLLHTDQYNYFATLRSKLHWEA